MASHYLVNLRVENTAAIPITVRDKFNLKGLKITDKFGQQVPYEIFINEKKVFKGSGIWKYSLAAVADQTLKGNLDNHGSHDYLKCHKLASLEIRLKRKESVIYMVVLEAKYGDASKYPPIVKVGWDMPVATLPGVRLLPPATDIDTVTRQQPRLSAKAGDSR